MSSETSLVEKVSKLLWLQSWCTWVGATRSSLERFSDSSKRFHRFPSIPS